MPPNRTRILVTALNPSIDAEWRVDEIRWEEKNSIRSERRWAGGKGVNVARWLRHLGNAPVLLLPLGGPTGDELADYLDAEKLPARIIPIRQATRVNVVVTTNDGKQMRFNPAGPHLSRQEWNRLVKSLRAQFNRAGWLILSGSLPRGVPATAYAQLVRLAHRFGVRTLLDCDGAAFAEGVKARPFLVKPNEHELAQWWKRRVDSEAEVLRAARDLSKATGGWVFVSRGGRKALLLNDALQLAAWAQPPRVVVRNTVAAGDALLAAVAHQVAAGAPPEDWLRNGVAAGSAATRCPGGQLPPRASVQRLKFRPVVSELDSHDGRFADTRRN